MEYENKNTGVIFKNDRKERANHPDLTGKWFDAEGNEYWLSAWTKADKNNRTYFSLSARLKEDAPAEPVADGMDQVVDDLEADKPVDLADIPFNQDLSKS